MKKLLSLLRFIFSVSLLAGLCYIGIVYALNTWDTGYQVTNNQAKDITLQDSSCRRITNNNTNRFIPTKTMAEWNAFNAAAAGQGVTIGSCNTSGQCGSSSNTCLVGTPSGYSAGSCGGYNTWTCLGTPSNASCSTYNGGCCVQYTYCRATYYNCYKNNMNDVPPIPTWDHTNVICNGVMWSPAGFANGDICLNWFFENPQPYNYEVCY